MPQQKLQQSIDALRDHVSENDALDDDRRQELDALAIRIETMMNEDVEHWEERLVDNLEQNVIQYQEEHPVAARILREIITTLSNIGL